jgi:hypothetical protein
MDRDQGNHDTRHVFSRCIPLLVLAPFLIGVLFALPFPAAASSLSSDTPQATFGWLRTFDQDTANATSAIVATHDGGAVAATTIGSSPETGRILVIKTDAAGHVSWNKTLPHNAYSVTSIVETSDSGYVLTATSRDSSTGGFLVIKLDQSGNEVWTRLFKNGELTKSTTVGTTSDGGLIIAGSIFRNVSPTQPLWNGFVTKTNAAGIEQWTRVFKGENNDYTAFAEQTTDDGYIAAGTTGSYGMNGTSVYLLRLNEFGNEDWFVPYKIGPENTGTSVVQTPDGGYILAGTVRSVNSPFPDSDLFLVRTDSHGKELWRRLIPGWGRNASTPIILAADGTSIIARSSASTDSVQPGEISLLGFDLNGTEQVNQTFGLRVPFEVSGAAVIRQQGYLFTGSAGDPVNQGKILPAILTINQPLPVEEVPETTSLNLTIRTWDARNGTPVIGSHVYLDGESVGTSSDDKGIKELRNIAPGNHSIRITKTGFEEVTRKITVDKTEHMIIQLNDSKLIPLVVNGPVESKIDIVFIPSTTTYNCNLKKKIPVDTYTGDRQRFVNDITTKLIPLFSRLDTLTSVQVGLPSDYADRFNFYYYWDPEDEADAFDGCAGKLPEQFRKNTPATDVAIILYPSYLGMYSGSPCEPNACASGLGPGSGSQLKAPADSTMIFLHESGHVVFGLIDTYCGPTYYRENSPSPNVWSTLDACMTSAAQEHWNASECRQITKPATSRTPEACVKNFWKLDPDPDIMGSGAYSGRFGNASTLHIRYMLDTINRWNV